MSYPPSRHWNGARASRWNRVLSNVDIATTGSSSERELAGLNIGTDTVAVTLVPLSLEILLPRLQLSLNFYERDYFDGKHTDYPIGSGKTRTCSRWSFETKRTCRTGRERCMSITFSSLIGLVYRSQRCPLSRQGGLSCLSSFQMAGGVRPRIRPE